MTPSAPGQRCRVIGGRATANGEGKSPNFGKVVTTVSLHPERAGVEQERVWHCKSNSVLTTYYGAGTEADFLECWLEVLPPDPLLGVKRHHQKELEHD